MVLGEVFLGAFLQVLFHRLASHELLNFGRVVGIKKKLKRWSEMLSTIQAVLEDAEEKQITDKAVLRLSYHHLPSHLKRCFSFCSILPKDYEFDEEELVLLWMAEGLIQQPEENKQIEDLGSEYFHELLSRSLFQRSSSAKTKFVMHDLISELAQWASGEMCFTLEDKMDGSELRRSPAKIRHLSFFCGQYDDSRKFQAVSEMKGLRTFLPFSPPYPGRCYLTNYVPFELLPKLRCLRTLSLSGYCIIELPDSIGALQHLRYLNLCQTNIRSLPESTSSLVSLQTLLLRDCLHLNKLPANLGYLTNLRNLDVTNGESIMEMPKGIRKLTSLQTLSDFIIGKGKGSSLQDLMELKFLRGRICISKLENVVDSRDARESNLKNKENLDVLILRWTSDFEGSRNERLERDVLDMLQPHTNIKELTIQCYGGTKFPIWIGDPSFCYLSSLRLEDCEKCTSLPPLGLFPSLKDLSIKGMSGIKIIGPEFYGVSFSKPFPSLQVLCFQDMREWEGWIPYGDDHEQFHCLRELWIENCPKFVGNISISFPSLEKLVLLDCKQLVVSTPNLPMLIELRVKGCKELVHGGVVNFSSPNSVVISKITELTYLKEGFMQGLNNVEDLKIFDCDRLTSLWQSDTGQYQWFSFLQSLVIGSCPQLVSFSGEEVEENRIQGWGSKLKYLEVRRCESLVKLPQCLHNFFFLRELVIEACPRLVFFPDGGLPPMLRAIRIKNCSALAPMPATLICDCKYLENLFIEGCDSLMSFATRQLPSSLKRLEIRSCKNLQYLLTDGESSSSSSSSILLEKNSYAPALEYLDIYDCAALIGLSLSGELPTSLEHLQIKNCSELTFLSARSNLPTGLKHLTIENCAKLEKVAERFQDQSSLETIYIFGCENLNSLPDDLQKLRNLHEISIWYCPGLVSFPGGLPATKLRELCISWCEQFLALPSRLHDLTSLQELWIYDCPRIASFPEEGFPTKLTSLTLTNFDMCQPLFDWGLQRLNSLKDLYIQGGCSNVISFPQDETKMVLPASLTRLSIIEFPNLRYLSERGFQNLNFLEYLAISYCSKLASFPKKGLPSSLLQLYIYSCPLLEQNCKKKRGREWFKIAKVPCVRIDGRSIHEMQASEKPSKH